MKKKKYNIEGLDCANCARELEEAITKIDGVSSVVINFMMQKMEISYDEENEKEVFICTYGSMQIGGRKG